MIVSGKINRSDHNDFVLKTDLEKKADKEHTHDNYISNYSVEKTTDDTTYKFSWDDVNGPYDSHNAGTTSYEYYYDQEML